MRLSPSCDEKNIATWHADGLRGCNVAVFFLLFFFTTEFNRLMREWERKRRGCIDRVNKAEERIIFFRKNKEIIRENFHFKIWAIWRKIEIELKAIKKSADCIRIYKSESEYLAGNGRSWETGNWGFRARSPSQKLHRSIELNLTKIFPKSHFER